MFRIRILVFIILDILPNYHCVVDEKEFAALKEEVQNLRTMFQSFLVHFLVRNASGGAFGIHCLGHTRSKCRMSGEGRLAICHNKNWLRKKYDIIDFVPYS